MHFLTVKEQPFTSAGVWGGGIGRKNEGCDFVPRKHSAMSVSIRVVTTGVRDRGWGSLEHATWAACRTVPTTKSYPAPNVSSADKPCFVLQTSSGAGGWISHPVQELHEDKEREGAE